MTKADERAMLAQMLATASVVVKKGDIVPMADNLSASFVAKGIDKKRQAIKSEKPSRKRNWAAQRRYDEEHGTVNGYDESIEDALAMHRREMGDY